MRTKDKGKAMNYFLIKPTIEKAVQNHDTITQLAEQLGIAHTTAQKYRAKYLKEQGALNQKLADEMRNEYVVTTRNSLEVAHSTALQEVMKSKDKPKNINALTNVLSESREFLKLVGVFKQDETQRINADITIKWGDENAAKNGDSVVQSPPVPEALPRKPGSNSVNAGGDSGGQDSCGSE